MGNHDPTTSMFHCWSDTIFHKFLPCHPPDIHSSITPMQKKPGLITNNDLGRLFSCPISCGFVQTPGEPSCVVMLVASFSACSQCVQPPSAGGNRHTHTMLKLHLCLYLWNSLITIRHAFSDHGSVFSPRCLSLSSWNLEAFHTSYQFLFFLQNIAYTSLATAYADSNHPLWIAFLRQCQHLSPIFKADP